MGDSWKNRKGEMISLQNLFQIIYHREWRRCKCWFSCVNRSSLYDVCTVGWNDWQSMCKDDKISGEIGKDTSCTFTNNGGGSLHSCICEQ